MCSVAVFGWVRNVSADRSSAVLQERSIDAVEGDAISLTVYFTKNGPRFLELDVEIDISGSATGYTMHAIYCACSSSYTLCICSHLLQVVFFHFMNLEGMDYVLSQSNFFLENIPIPITVTLLNDGVAGEGPETITLTLRPDRDLEDNEILSNPTITISLSDNDSTLL